MDEKKVARRGLVGVSRKLEALRGKYKPTSDEAVFLSIARDMAWAISKGNWSKAKRLGMSVQEELEFQLEPTEASERVAAADADLEAIAEVVKGNSFMSLKGPLKKLGLRNVDFITADPPMPPAYWSMKTRRGKKVLIVNKKHADAGSRDIVVGDFVIGYM